NPNSEVAFCVEPGVPALNEWGYIPSKPTVLLTIEQQKEIEKIVHFGFDTAPKGELLSTSWKTYYVTTKLMIEEYLDWNIDIYKWDLPRSYSSVKSEIQTKIKNYNKNVSFNNNKYDVKKGETLTITDNNNVLSKMHIAKNTTGSKVTINNNKLNIDTVNYKTREIVLEKIPQNKLGTSLLYIKPKSQKMGVFKISDPMYSRVNLNIIESGNLEIIKTDEDTKAPIPNTQYEIYNAKNEL